MWFYDVTLIWAWHINEGVISLIDRILHCLLVIESCVLMLDQSSDWRGMPLSSFLVEVVQGLVENFSVLSCSSVIKFTKYLLKLFLELVSFVFKVSVHEFVISVACKLLLNSLTESLILNVLSPQTFSIRFSFFLIFDGSVLLFFFLLYLFLFLDDIMSCLYSLFYYNSLLNYNSFLYYNIFLYYLDLLLHYFFNLSLFLLVLLWLCSKVASILTTSLLLDLNYLFLSFLASIQFVLSALD